MQGSGNKRLTLQTIISLILMKYRIIYILVLSIFLYSCSGRTISQQKLPQIIAEIYLVDKYANEIVDKPFASMDSIRIYEPIFNKYGYTSDDYKRTIDKYISRPKKLRIYFENAKSILEEQKSSIQAKVTEHMQLDSIIGTYTRIMSSDNSKHAYYKGIQANKWIYFPYSDNRWPTQKAAIGITLPIGYNLFKIIPPKQSDNPIPPWAVSHIHSTADNPSNIDISDVSDTSTIPDVSDSQDAVGDEIYLTTETELEEHIFTKYGISGYPVWLFPSRTSIDTLRLGSSMNKRLLLR